MELEARRREQGRIPTMRQQAGCPVIAPGPHGHRYAGQWGHREIVQHRGVEIDLCERIRNLTRRLHELTNEIKLARAGLQREAVARERLVEYIAGAKAGLQRLSAQCLNAAEIGQGDSLPGRHDDNAPGPAFGKVRVHARDCAMRDGGSRAYRRCQAWLDAALRTARSPSTELRCAVTDDVGLHASLHAALVRSARASGWKEDFAADRMPMRLVPEIEAVCLCVAEMALHNAARHAQATRVGIRLRHMSEEIELTVRDDGKGEDFSGTWHDLGSLLITPEQRAILVAGRLEILAARGAGTEVRATFPAYWQGGHDARPGVVPAKSGKAVHPLPAAG